MDINFNALKQHAVWPRQLVMITLVLALTACASTPQNTSSDPQADAVVALNPDQIRVKTDAEIAQDPDLPKIELDAQTLEDLLVSNLASFSGDWTTATASSLNVAKSSKDFRLARLATLLALRNDDYPTAAESASLWVDLKPDDADAQNMHLLALVGAGKTEQAIDTIDQARVDREIDEYIKQLAALLVRQRNDVSGFAVVSHLVEQYPESAQVLLSSAYVAESFQLFEAAEAWVEQALDLRPKWDLAAQMKANLLQTRNKTAERTQFIAEFVKDNPTSVAMRINHAGELARAKDYQAAYDVMRKVLKDAPDNVGALQYAGALSEALENPDQAGKHYRRALRAAPDNDDVRWSLARLAVSNQEYAKAERLFNAISSEELAFRAQIQVANMRYETQGVEVAVNTLWSLEPSTTDEWMDVVLARHYLLMQAQRYEDALGFINEAIVYVPDHQELLYSRALVAAELKDVAMAERDLRAVIAQNDKHANALNALGYTLADQTDRFEEARDLIAKALELRPKDAHILDSMGWVSYRLGDLDKAVEYLHKAYQASPEIEIAAHLGEVLFELGRTDEATAIWRESYIHDPSNPVMNDTLQRYGVSFPSTVSSTD